MSVTVSEYAMTGASTPTSMQEHPEHREELLVDDRPKTSDKLRHTAKGLEAIGFNEHASMYHHGYRQYSVDSQTKTEKRKSGGEKKERPGGLEKKRTMSLIKKLIGGKEKEKERGEKVGEGAKA